jgi:hypothetical protein
MKRIILLVAVCGSAIVFTSSCRRCSTCSYTFKPNGTTVDSTISVPQVCGNKQDRDTYENSVKADAALVGGEVTCEN